MDEPTYVESQPLKARRRLVSVRHGSTLFAALFWLPAGFVFVAAAVLFLAGVLSVFTTTLALTTWRDGRDDADRVPRHDHRERLAQRRDGVATIKRDAAWDVETVWQTSDVSMYLSNPVVVGDALYGLSQRSSGEYFALDAQSGKVLWLGPPRQATNTAVVKANDLLFLLNDDGELIVAKATRAAFEPLKRYVVADGATWAQPAITGKRIFIKDTTALTLWTVE